MGNKFCGLYCLGKRPGIPALFKNSSPCGLTLIELVLVVAIIGTVSGIAIPAYTGHVDKVNSQKGVSDILNIELSIEKFYAENGRYPDSLAEIGKDGLRDPWGQPYQYLRLPSDEQARKLVAKKLQNIHPINNDYDLWSNGKDGNTKQNVNNHHSLDDIIRAFDGAYVGLARDIS